MMKSTLYLIVFFLLVFCVNVKAQVTFKTEYIGNSSLIDKDGNEIGDSKGAALVYKGGVNLPFSMKLDDKSRPTIWGMGVSGSYVSFNNKNISKDLSLTEMLGFQMALYHMRPLNDKWSMMASVGFGLYMPNTQLSRIRYRNFLGNVGVIFIRKVNPHLEIGGGIALNNTFGYPMIFPALYFNWIYEGRFTFSLSMMDGGEMSVKYNVNKLLTVGLIAEMSGQGVILEKNGKDMMFSHQYIVVGLRPEIKINRYISIPITVGASIMRSASYDKRSLKSLFDNKGTDSDFKESFYISGGIKVSF